MILVPLRDVKTGRCGALQLVTMMKIANGDFAQITVEIFLLFFLFINVQHSSKGSKTWPGMPHSFNGAKQSRGQRIKKKTQFLQNSPLLHRFLMFQS